jgi:predicted alpha/beta superfamily hydrolase
MRFLLWLKVHIGFYTSYNNTVLRSAITNAVRKARKLHGHSDIIVTGHSMGGAIASFCALDLAVSDPQILNIYFFAQGSIFTVQGVTIGGMECFFPLHDL